MAHIAIYMETDHTWITLYWRIDHYFPLSVQIDSETMGDLVTEWYQSTKKIRNSTWLK